MLLERHAVGETIDKISVKRFQAESPGEKVQHRSCSSFSLSELMMKKKARSAASSGVKSDIDLIGGDDQPAWNVVVMLVSIFHLPRDIVLPDQVF